MARRPWGGGPRIELTHDALNVRFYRADANSGGVGDKLIAHAHAHAHAHTRSEICEDAGLAKEVRELIRRTKIRCGESLS